MIKADQKSIVEEKRELRRAVLARRDAMEPTLRAHKSQIIDEELTRIFDHAYAAAPEDEPYTVALYNAFGSEVDLDMFARHVWKAGGQVAFPCMERLEGERTRGRRARMVMRLVSRETYKQHAYALAARKIHEGTDTEDHASEMGYLIPFLSAVTKAFDPHDPALSAFTPIEPSRIAMAVVPLVAFDSQDGRLGYGGGNYDEFLPALDASAVIVGVGFEEQRVDKVPREAHDLSLPRIISA